MLSMARRLGDASRWLYVLPALLLVVVFVYYPAVDNLRLSFFSWSSFSPKEAFVGLQNYRDLAADPIFWGALFNNVAYAVVSVIFQVGGGLVLAAILEEFVAPRLRGFFRTVFFIPAVMSLTVVGFLFYFLYEPNFGLVNQAMTAIGLGSFTHAWLGEESTAIWSIIAMSQWQSFGYVMVLFIVAIQKIPRELYEAAYIDGASKIQAFRRITVPLVFDMTELMLIVTVSGAFLVFNEVWVMTQGGPNNASHTLGSWLYKSGFFNDQLGYAAAIGAVIFVITFAASALQLSLRRGRTVQF
ncbi:MAG TPA: sugar ABC transporter permease [Candidatus Limnocylindrales bacterium]